MLWRAAVHIIGKAITKSCTWSCYPVKGGICGSFSEKCILGMVVETILIATDRYLYNFRLWGVNEESMVLGENIGQGVGYNNNRLNQQPAKYKTYN